MVKTKIISEEVESVIASWPTNIQVPVRQLRELIFATAKRNGNLKVDESLKWNEPAYSTDKGSPVRLGWSNKTPDLYRLHFICTSKLADTCKALYADTLNFEGERAIVFHRAEPLPRDEVCHCISLALRYHQIKSLPNLGC